VGLLVFEQGGVLNRIQLLVRSIPISIVKGMPLLHAADAYGGFVVRFFSEGSSHGSFHETHPVRFISGMGRLPMFDTIL
jgi:hypothetical protein